MDRGEQPRQRRLPLPPRLRRRRPRRPREGPARLRQRAPARAARPADPGPRPRLALLQPRPRRVARRADDGVRVRRPPVPPRRHAQRRGARLDCDRARRRSSRACPRTRRRWACRSPAARCPGVGSGALVGVHGSWNRRPAARAGGRLLPLRRRGHGWAAHDHGRVPASGGQRWGRPVAAVQGADGAVYVSDDLADAVYRLAPPAGASSTRQRTRLPAVGTLRPLAPRGCGVPRRGLDRPAAGGLGRLRREPGRRSRRARRPPRRPRRRPWRPSTSSCPPTSRRRRSTSPAGAGAAGWSVCVWARVDGARLLAWTPDGRLLVSRPKSGDVDVVTPAAATRPRRPGHPARRADPAARARVRRRQLYVAQSDRVDALRLRRRPGDRPADGGRRAARREERRPARRVRARAEERRGRPRTARSTSPSARPATSPRRTATPTRSGRRSCGSRRAAGRPRSSRAACATAPGSPSPRTARSGPR